MSKELINTIPLHAPINAACDEDGGRFAINHLEVLPSPGGGRRTLRAH